MCLKNKNPTENSEIIMVSACLAGVKCRYDGLDSFNASLLEELKNKAFIICCPEVLAGLPIPRIPCNIHGGDGFEVLNGKAKIIGIDNNDYTQPFITGAALACKIALNNKVKTAYLKKNSPTCGHGKIYAENGKDLIDGSGVLAALLIQNNIEIKSL